MPQPILDPRKLCQIALVVPDIQAAAERYAAIFGQAVPVPQETGGPEATHIDYRGQSTGARAKLAFFQAGDGLSIELIEPLGLPSVWKEGLDETGQAVHHIAFRTADMEGTLKRLAEQGCPTVQRGDFKGGCYAYVDTRPLLGVMVELLASR